MTNRLIVLLSLITTIFICVAILCTKEKDIVLPPVEIPYKIKPEPIPPVNVFEYGESCTGVSAEILYGIAMTESDLTPNAYGDRDMGDGSHGLMQINENYRKERVGKWGEYDPYNPKDAVYIAGMIIKENMAELKCVYSSILAYNRGLYSVKNIHKNEYDIFDYDYLRNVLENAKGYEEISYNILKPIDIYLMMCIIYHIQTIRSKK